MMRAAHGWKSTPSPRRGFTVVEASRGLGEAPVVVAVHVSVQGIRLFRIGLEEAMGRSRNLVVLDFGMSPLREALEDDAGDVDPRERRSMRTLAANPRVKMLRMEPSNAGIAETLSYCDSVEASLLIVSADYIGGLPQDENLTNRLFGAAFDLLVVTDNPPRDRQEAHQPGDGG